MAKASGKGRKIDAKVRTCLAFRDQAEEAARFYVSLLPGSEIENVFRPDPAGPALTVLFTLAGTPYQTLNMGDYAKPNDAASISVVTADQEETDRLWEALLADGGAAIQCGWLRDRFGLSWQIVPEALPCLLTDPDRAAAARAMQAMMGMVKLDIAALEAAFRG
jgi:predicted 3-demethylubiquinone-9 3-methyltransferase (glyoxalase superfamily)